ncbi:pyridoxamine 5'-phosphate oxidase [Nocardioides alcanivorans]|uniref:pyridoxamine 5'-phosphate oxidase n=1 Tax=Nocardioides alcanivorans TaxID=2897352 RepID=UPI001F2BB907|nr:pyridoxamine 5'-phosphate oxidase [Nocardioides alcanivorans]
MSDSDNPWAARRTDYSRSGLVEADLEPDPVQMFRRWYDDAVGLPEPNAMVVATVSAEGHPSVRTVLLKGLDHEGARFFTNHGSRKGNDLEANPHCALLFPWHPIERQIRIEGVAEPLSRADVATYFSSRPRGAQIGAWASRQSRPTTADALADAFTAAETAHPDEVPVPDEWGGYLVRPQRWEFWQGRPNRLHDRLCYLPDGDGWRVVRLAP